MLGVAFSALLLGHLGKTIPGEALPAYRPSNAEIATAYRRADAVGGERAAATARLRLEANWIEDGAAFWYRRDAIGGGASFVRVDARTGARTPLFDAPRLAAALAKETGKPVDPERLPFRTVRTTPGMLRFEANGRTFSLTLSDYTLKAIEADPARRPDAPWRQETWPPAREPVASPDGRWTARIEGANILVRPKDGAETPLTKDGSATSYYARLRWAADSRHLVAVRVHPGDRKRVYLVQSTPPDGGPAKLTERIYDRPGDRVDTFDVLTLDPTGAGAPVAAVPVEYGGLPELRPTRDGAFTYDVMDRGYGRWRLLRLDPATGRTSTVFDDDPATFVDSTALIQEPLERTDEVLVSSERDGWHHLYLADGKGGARQVTRGPWVVRSIARVDEARRQIVFGASGREAGEDPYFIHYYRIDFDGRNLVPLTPAPGNHAASLAPDGETLVDAYSTPTAPPVFELRNARTGARIAEVDRADVTGLAKTGWRAPEPFVAKGRDGTTDIYGLVYRPSNFDPTRRYPVVEDIYAGPQDSFVPKSFSPTAYDQSVAELGFIVVKIDGMGTRNRSKAFHDVCYRDLADAGFPDRILWMKALGRKYPQADLTRVGVFGTSAGGQNAGGAVIFHPEFYRAAVASCGCHDNRLDKIWWNEQWMGLIGPHYAASSNIDQAARMGGALMLIVGELDTNVPPESTYRFGAALQAAGKEYELVVIPNADHTSGGPYGERKRRDFLIRHLVDPAFPGIAALPAANAGPRK